MALKKIIATTLSLCLLMIYVMPTQGARELSKSAKIFKEVQDGVVTIFTSVGHGSGFLIDDTGLILTNSHVVREAANNVRVRFGPNIVLEGDILIQDRENDLAIVYVNLEKIKAYKALKCFMPENQNDLVIVGEKVIAIGSPIDRESLEKTVTEGIISKFENDVIRHDTAINAGNSGGPLINFDGKVVGINTFVTSNTIGQNIAGAVPIYKVLEIYKTVKKELNDKPKPNKQLLPDVPRVSYPYHELLKEDEAFFTEYKKRKAFFKNRHFIFSVQTPPINVYYLKEVENKVLKRRKKRAKKKGFEISDDEYDSKNLFKYYNYKKPVVTVGVMAIPKLTKGSKAKKVFAFLGAATATTLTLGLAAPTLALPVAVGRKKEFKKDFYEMKLVNDKNEVYIPYASGRLPIINEAAFMFGCKTFEMVADKSYLGCYEFDPSYFKTESPLKLIVKGEGIKEKEMTIEIPDEIKEYIKKDFEVYWKETAKLNKQKEKELYDSEKSVLAKLIEKNTPGNKTTETETSNLQENNDLPQEDKTFTSEDNSLNNIITDLEIKTFQYTSENLPTEERLSLLELHYFNNQLSNMSNKSRIKAIQNKLKYSKKKD